VNTKNDGAQKSGADVACSAWLACPFCGSTKITVEWEGCPPIDATDTNRRWFAECAKCSCQGPFCQKEPQVRPSWNKRVSDHEWTYQKGRALADKWCDAVGQPDEKKRENLAVWIATFLAT
jgi:hypothetical protein